MNVHLFGNGPSPAVATFGLRKTAADGEEKFGKAASNFVHRNFYVDDGLTSLPTAKQAVDLVTAAQRMLATANLRTPQGRVELRGSYGSVSSGGQRERYTRPRLAP